jgi:hypothetical protein
MWSGSRQVSVDRNTAQKHRLKNGAGTVGNKDENDRKTTKNPKTTETQGPCPYRSNVHVPDLWAQGVAQLEALQAIATVCRLAHNIQDRFNKFCILCVMPFRPIVASNGLPKDESILHPLCNARSPSFCLQRFAQTQSILHPLCNALSTSCCLQRFAQRRMNSAPSV